MPQTSDDQAGGDQVARAARVRELVADGARLLSLRRPGEAAEKLAEAHALDPYNVPAAINLGGAYILQGRFKLAVPVLEAASQLEPDNVMIWTNLAAAYLGNPALATTEQQDKAIWAYQRALALDPKTPHAHYNLGLIYLARNDLQNAVLQFTGALETDPHDRDARRYLDELRRNGM